VKKRFDTTHLEKMLSASKRPLLVGHFNPDGDAVGALTAMFHYLRDRGMTPSAVLPSPYPDYLAFLIEEGTPITIHSRERRKRQGVDRFCGFADLFRFQSIKSHGASGERYIGQGLQRC
jgi:nanoRNase/pAp phosphatase (c-di-AMP/oligoRNAs hydrolase)